MITHALCGVCGAPCHAEGGTPDEPCWGDVTKAKDGAHACEGHVTEGRYTPEPRPVAVDSRQLGLPGARP